MHTHLRKLGIGATCAVMLAVAGGIPAAAMVNPSTGQPGAPTNTCGPSNPMTPGRSATAAVNEAIPPAGVVIPGTTTTGREPRPA